MKLLHWTFAALIAAPSSAAAQGCSHTSELADDMLESYAPTFFGSDPANVAERGSVIQQLTGPDARYVVHDDAVCSRVLAAAIPNMRQASSVWSAGREGSYQVTVLRYGPYLAVSIGAAAAVPIPSPNPDVIHVPATGDGALIVYRASDLERLKVFR
jgi:hypothetical protein